jgi:hypothetical protein
LFNIAFQPIGNLVGCFLMRVGRFFFVGFFHASRAAFFLAR